jgi:lysophospholipase L1-like esterase
LLPLGDSITQADATHLSYRYWLWELLSEAGLQVDFVGSMNTHFQGTPTYPNPAFDPDHEGHYGWRADQLLAELPTWLQSYTPSAVILHIGTNDVAFGQPIEETLDEIAALVGLLREDNPEVVVFLAELIPLNIGGAGVEPLNEGIVRLGPELNTTQSPVIVVERGTFGASDLFDNVHPNETGEKKMAAAFFAAIETAMRSGLIEPCEESNDP